MLSVFILKRSKVYDDRSHTQAGRASQPTVQKLCTNCDEDGNCLLYDDGKEAKCVQLISRYGIYCNYFLKAVLPAEKELYSEILQQNGVMK